jgi:hypothetical protein
MPLDLGSLFKKAPPKPPSSLGKLVTAGAGGGRDAYLKHVEEQALAGNPALSWEEWLKTQQTGK